MELAAIYSGQAERLSSVVLDHADRSTSPVPACPEWQVRDVLAHVVGLARDVVAGALPVMDLLEQWRDEDVATVRDAMTATQVERAADRTVEDLVDEWRALVDTMAPMFDGEVLFPEPAPFGLGAILITDLAVHDQDVHAALGVARPTDRLVQSFGVATYCFGVDYRVLQLGLPALVVRYGERERVLGEGGPGATVTADRYELLRALAGRRSRRQILTLDWDGDPDPYLPLIPAYGERADDLVD